MILRGTNALLSNHFTSEHSTMNALMETLYFQYTITVWISPKSTSLPDIAEHWEVAGFSRVTFCNSFFRKIQALDLPPPDPLHFHIRWYN